MIIAMGIVVTGIMSAMTLASANLNASQESAARFVASNLAREGIEAVRARRDGNWLAGADWEQGLVGVASDRTAILELDPDTAARSLDFDAASIDDAAAKVFRGVGDADPERNLLRQFPGGAAPAARYVDTGFRRLISLFPICHDLGGSEIVVESDGGDCGAGFTEVGLDARVQVSWKVKTSKHSITSEEKIYDWR